jgi:LmbE family N-acetylglucosaminyl deacetylase
MFSIRTDSGIEKKETLASVIGATPGKDTIMFIAAHDDDSPIGAGLAMAKAVDEGFDVHMVMCTNGCMGYCSMDQKENISSIRMNETVESCRILGVKEENIHCLGFADGSLYNYIGRAKAKDGEPEVEGFTGLENHMTWIMRKLKPTFIFTPAGSDLHPDHKAVYKELLISIFHASGDIWPELGEPISMPEVYEFPIYVDLEGEPEIMLEADDATFERKLENIAAYKSQKQISLLVEEIRKAGPVEFFRNLRFALYSPEKYRKFFQ